VLAAAVALSPACGTVSGPAAGASDSPRESGAAAGGPDEDTSTATAGPRGDPEPARRGADASSQRLRFRPTELALPGGSTAPVVPVATDDGELVVPEDVDRLGWWDGGAYAGDPFGSAVIAGHIDSAEQGVGYFGQLLSIEVGDEVTVRGDEATLTYRVSRTALIDKDVLVSDSAAFDQGGEHRLVLITCWGRWRPEVSSYESNYVVFADPVGLAR
jgi:LPXTG-site transpeptidase (sortase) family protein